MSRALGPPSLGAAGVFSSSSSSSLRMGADTLPETGPEASVGSRWPAGKHSQHGGPCDLAPRRGLRPRSGPCPPSASPACAAQLRMRRRPRRGSTLSWSPGRSAACSGRRAAGRRRCSSSSQASRNPEVARCAPGQPRHHLHAGRRAWVRLRAPELMRCSRT
jgi:hypothetical protein